ncbi:MAG: PIN domain-containing protein [Nanoarchaeota archaeon]
MNNYFFDSSAIIEIVEGNPEYARFKDLKITTTTLNVAEVYFYFLKNFNQKTADYWVKKINFDLINILKLNIMIEAAKFRFGNLKDNLSYVDCIGYLLSKELNIKFLTKDSKFKGKENVELIY